MGQQPKIRWNNLTMNTWVDGLTLGEKKKNYAFIQEGKMKMR